MTSSEAIEQKGAAWLEQEDGTRLQLGASTLLGSEVSPGDGHQLQRPTVSRRHAFINVQEGGEYWIVDRGSTNGTYLNSARLLGAQRLRDGDRFSLGQTVHLLFRQPVSPEMRRAQTMAQGTMVETWSERRWLFFADLAKSTELTQTLPAAEMPRVIGGWLSRCRDVILQHGGSMNKYTGDGWIAYWRATQGAAPQVAAAIRELHSWQGKPLPFRLVIHLGQIVIGGGPSLGEESMFSPDLSFASRLDELAKSLKEPLLLSRQAAEELANNLATTQIHGEHHVRDHGGVAVYRLSS